MRSLKLIKDFMDCKNRICFCVEYLNFSNHNHFKIYNECYKIKRENMKRDIVSPKMIKYVQKPFKMHEDYGRR